MKKILLILAIALPFVFISCKDDKDEPTTPDNHEYVDLGLPSGTLWATCNVGANSPEEYGDHFAWGETEPKESYDCTNYKWAYWERVAISDHYYQVNVTWYKYYFKDWIDNAYVEGDGKPELDPEDDAAYVNWGPKWRMPSLEQLQELLEYCSWKWTQRNGVNGNLVTGPNGKTIFLPAAGGRSEKQLYFDGDDAYYWTRTLCNPDKLTIEVADQEMAYILHFSSSEWDVWYDIRYDGCTVRAVRASKK
ncbi:MAG: hypothetical protein IJK93_00070 [Muribaculaceae bacterium]|nr:hypothetical protein [Muribaculaceae bacterium]